MIDLLLEHPDVDPNLRTSDDKCALQFALMPPYTDGPPFDLASRLIQKGARSNPSTSDNNNNLLQLLAVSELEDAAVFLSESAYVNHVNRTGLTALHIACQKGLPKLTKALLEYGASPNIQSGIDEMKTPIHYAVEAKHKNILEIFVDAKDSGAGESPDFNLKTVDGDSSLSLALKVDAKDLVPVLIKGGADVNVRNGQDLTLLHQAILKEDS